MKDGRKEGRKEGGRKEGRKEAMKQGSEEARKQRSKEARKQRSKEAKKERRKEARNGRKDEHKKGRGTQDAGIHTHTHGFHTVAKMSLNDDRSSVFFEALRPPSNPPSRFTLGGGAAFLHAALRVKIGIVILNLIILKAVGWIDNSRV